MIGKNKLIPFMGIELSKSEIESYKAWLCQEESKIHNRVVDAMIAGADANALKSPQQGQDWNLFTALREQFIGQGVGYRRIKNLPRALDEI